MAQIKWVNFLHIYQPPRQDQEVIDKIVDESYYFIIELLKNNPELKITLNISASLTEQLLKFGYSDIIDSLKNFAMSGQVEFVGTAAYHPILPLLDSSEIIRQIELNREINGKAFGSVYDPKGFFFPEMAYGKEAGALVKKAGFEWIILDEIAVEKNINYERLYIDRDTNLKVIFRNRKYSEMYVPKGVQGLLQKDLKSKQYEYLVTATDGELYGHQHKDKTGIYGKIVKNKDLVTITCSQYLNELSKKEFVALRSCSWSTSEIDIKNDNPYPLWLDHKNEIHKSLWKFTKRVIKTVQNSQNDDNYNWARRHLDIGLASCTFWWSSKRKPSPFAPLTWNPDEVIKGLHELIKSVRSLEKLNNRIKLDFEHEYYDIKYEIWKHHWKSIHNNGNH